MKPYRLDYLNETFLQRIEDQMSFYLRSDPGAHKTYSYWLGVIRNTICKRVLFDSVQARTFAPLTEFPDNMASHVRAPFDIFYMEFNEPVSLAPGWHLDEQDVLRALLYADFGKEIDVMSLPGSLTAGEPVISKRRAAHLVLFYTDTGEVTFTDRHFRIDIQQGAAYVTRRMASLPVDARTAENLESAVSVEAYLAEGRTLSGGLEMVPLDDAVSIRAGDFAEGRVVGWWEEQAIMATNFLRWCFAYMMAKSIIIERVEPPISRQVRRNLLRHKRPLPLPWHIVQVDPRYVETYALEGAQGREHGYRYDVIGHLRLGRHRIKLDSGDWGYREGLEWVPPHQRGLKHSLYIPKTYAVDERRKVLPELKHPEQEEA